MCVCAWLWNGPMGCICIQWRSAHVGWNQLLGLTGVGGRCCGGVVCPPSPRFSLGGRNHDVNVRVRVGMQSYWTFPQASRRGYLSFEAIALFDATRTTHQTNYAFARLSPSLSLTFFSSPPLPSNGDGEIDGEICAANTTTVRLVWWYPEERGQGLAQKRKKKACT